MRHSLCPALLIIGSGMIASAQDIAGEFPRGSRYQALGNPSASSVGTKGGRGRDFLKKFLDRILRLQCCSYGPRIRVSDQITVRTVHHAWVRVSALYRRAVDGAHAIYASSIRGRSQPEVAGRPRGTVHRDGRHECLEARELHYRCGWRRAVSPQFFFNDA